jgi:hypothetical protein
MSNVLQIYAAYTKEAGLTGTLDDQDRDNSEYEMSCISCSSTAATHAPSGGVFCLGLRRTFKGRGTYFKGSFVPACRRCIRSSSQRSQDGCSIAFKKKQKLSEILNRTVYANAGAGRNSGGNGVADAENSQEGIFGDDSKSATTTHM